MVKIIWSDLAVDDLKSIHDYISKDSSRFAADMIERFLQIVDQLETYPKSGRKSPEINNESIRGLIPGNYRIVYLIKENSISISRIHHRSKSIN